MPLDRVLEAETMDTAEEALAYDTMDHSEVNRRFVADLLERWPDPRWVLDIGTGTGLIPICLAAAHPRCQVIAVDLAEHMLERAQLNVAQAGFTARIDLRRIDAKSLPFARGQFDVVMSNSIVHHIPDPRSLFREIAGLVKPGQGLFVRDLYRPEDRETLNGLVERYAGEADPVQRALFQASLGAALTVEEVRAMGAEAGLRDVAVEMTSDRHWTLWSP